MRDMPNMAILVGRNRCRCTDDSAIGYLVSYFDKGATEAPVRKVLIPRYHVIPQTKIDKPRRMVNWIALSQET